ncbi:MAG: hypothetical protein P8J50_00325 [Acidimicrobiales bacterium]|jgi:hypothetical protein|nr:hypothetical protein [Acidimicrobiales bacterium]
MGAIRTALRSFLSKPDNKGFAALARPIDPADYEIPELDGSGVPVAEIPLDGTKEGATPDVWAPRTLTASREPLPAGYPDLRGVWEVVEGRMTGNVQRIEQAGNRITITVGGLVHDMFCDGTLENGVDDIGGFNGSRIRVAATMENGVHKLRPGNKKIVAVTRQLADDGETMIWRYGPGKNNCRRLTERPTDHPATKAAIEAANS